MYVQYSRNIDIHIHEDELNGFLKGELSSSDLVNNRKKKKDAILEYDRLSKLCDEERAKNPSKFISIEERQERINELKNNIPRLVNGGKISEMENVRKEIIEIQKILDEQILDIKINHFIHIEAGGFNKGTELISKLIVEYVLNWKPIENQNNLPVKDLIEGYIKKLFDKFGIEYDENSQDFLLEPSTGLGPFDKMYIQLYWSFKNYVFKLLNIAKEYEKIREGTYDLAIEASYNKIYKSIKYNLEWRERAFRNEYDKEHFPLKWEINKMDAVPLSVHNTNHLPL